MLRRKPNHKDTKSTKTDTKEENERIFCVNLCALGDFVVGFCGIQRGFTA